MHSLCGSGSWSTFVVYASASVQCYFVPTQSIHHLCTAFCAGCGGCWCARPASLRRRSSSTIAPDLPRRVDFSYVAPLLRRTKKIIARLDDGSWVHRRRLLDMSTGSIPPPYRTFPYLIPSLFLSYYSSPFPIPVVYHTVYQYYYMAWKFVHQPKPR